jgi:hypothetical protein
MATTKKSATTTKTKVEVESVEPTKTETKVETKPKVEKKYVVLTVSSYPMEVSKEQFNEIKNSADNIVESETDDTIYLRIVK